ncbi:hypothetical protein NDU88_003710 [Pleurodeles waltl]|uniref:Uncharacterized protein n=1 Tax=Pleurodeles waltl TaxID=8319 RepID=A0AAV7SGR7_PLEWA|nr:hypothetical protein NDU88_003710 [Pleurodeles waltl]
MPVVTGFWSAPGSTTASVARSQSTDSPPPVKHKRLASARRERGKKSATKSAPTGTIGSVDTAATPSKVGKGHSKTGKSGKISKADMTAGSPAAQDKTAHQQPRCPGQDRQQQQPRCPGQDRHQQPRCPGQDRQQSCCPGPPPAAPLPRTRPPAAAPLPRTRPPAAAPLPRTRPPAAPLPRTRLPPATPLPRTRPPPAAPLPRTRPPAPPQDSECQ